MNVLALDTSTPSTAVGLMLGRGEALAAYDHPRAGERPGHQARLLPLAAQLLERAGLDWARLDRVAVGVGPGTYTGLRVGVASARGLAQSLGTEIVGISSSAALAHAAFRSGHAGPAFAIVDARRAELFVGAYAPAAQGSVPAVLGEPRPVGVGELLDALAEIGADAGVRVGDAWIAVGEGVASARETLAAAGVNVPAVDSPLHRVDAVALCELATRVRAQPLEAVVPDYRRPADAELARARLARDAARPQEALAGGIAR